MTQRDIENSKREACERAKAEGRAEGAAKNSRKVARKMKAEGIADEVIAKCTGLPIEEIEAL